MNNDPEMASYYREAYDDYRAEKEADEVEANRVFNKYNYLYDNEY